MKGSSADPTDDSVCREAMKLEYGAWRGCSPSNRVPIGPDSYPANIEGYFDLLSGKFRAECSTEISFPNSEAFAFLGAVSDPEGAVAAGCLIRPLAASRIVLRAAK